MVAAQLRIQEGHSAGSCTGCGARRAFSMSEKVWTDGVLWYDLDCAPGPASATGAVSSSGSPGSESTKVSCGITVGSGGFWSVRADVEVAPLPGESLAAARQRARDAMLDEVRVARESVREILTSG